MKPFYYLVHFPNIENLDTLKIALGITGSELNTYKRNGGIVVQDIDLEVITMKT